VIPFRGNETDYMHLKPMADLGQIYPMVLLLEWLGCLYIVNSVEVPFKG